MSHAFLHLENPCFTEGSTSYMEDIAPSSTFERNLALRGVPLQSTLCHFCASQEEFSEYFFFLVPNDLQDMVHMHALDSKMKILSYLKLRPCNSCNRWVPLWGKEQVRWKWWFGELLFGTFVGKKQLYFRPGVFSSQKLVQEIVFYLWLWIKNLMLCNVLSFA